MAAVPSIGRANLVEPRPVAPEAAATHALYERHASRIQSYCLHQLGSREEAEDAVQTTFMNAFRALRKGITPEAESAWLFKIAENVCLSRRRSTWRRGRIESPSDFQMIEEIVPGPNRQRDELIGIEDALAGMPEQQRRAILLREWQGLSYREIAEELEVTQAAVETLIFRARRSLAQGLEQPETVAGKRKGLRRALHALDLGSLVGVAKALLTGGAAVKATAAAVAVTAAAGAAITAHPERQNHASNARPAVVVQAVPALSARSSLAALSVGSATAAAPISAKRSGSAAESAQAKAVLKVHRERAARLSAGGSALGSGGRTAALEPVEGAAATAPPAVVPVVPVAAPAVTPPAAPAAPDKAQQPPLGGDAKAKDELRGGSGGTKGNDEQPKAAVPVAAAPAETRPVSKEQAKETKQEARETAREAKQDSRELARAPQNAGPIVPTVSAPTVVAPPVVVVPSAPDLAPTAAVISAPAPAPVADSGRGKDKDRDKGDRSNGNGRNRG